LLTYGNFFIFIDKEYINRTIIFYVKVYKNDKHVLKLFFENNLYDFIQNGSPDF